MGENKRKTGAMYEELAAEFLQSQGFHILERNYFCKFGEIDIIAIDGDYLVFAEIKYRKSIEYGFPQEAVSYVKQRKIIKSAQYYCMRHLVNEEMPIRFDVIGILGEQVTLIKDAFDATGV